MEQQQEDLLKIPTVSLSHDKQMPQMPSPGRVVIFRKDGKNLAATVAFAHSETCVNIGYLTVDGEHHNETSVLLAETSEQEGRWSWPVRV